jgi:hypothetical protein
MMFRLSFQRHCFGQEVATDGVIVGLQRVDGGLVRGSYAKRGLLVISFPWLVARNFPVSS